MHSQNCAGERCSGLRSARSCVIANSVALLLATAPIAQPGEKTLTLPYQTGSHLQLVRDFFTTANGLPANEIRAVAVTREGAVLVAAGKGVERLDGERWIAESGPVGVSALFAPEQGPEALAGATNGLWTLTKGEWKLQADGPTGVTAFAREPAGVPWALAPSGVWRLGGRWELINDVEDDEMLGPRRLLPRGSNEVLVAADTGLFELMGKRKYWLPLEVRPDRLISKHVRDLAWLDKHHFLIATDQGLNISSGGTTWQLLTGNDGLPILDLTYVVTARDGTVWLGSDQGLMRWSDGQWRYLAGKRWLPDNRVTAIASAPEGTVWVGTPQGLAHIYHRKLTLEEKAAIVQRNLEARDRRHGFVTDMYLRAPGVTEGAVQEISDNDGLWTSLYIAGESYRYAVTKSPEAKAQAWRSMQAMLRLESITGISGFPARAICHTNESQFKSRSLRSSSEWHESPVEKDWFWKGETSSDEIDGHYFGWYVFYELAGNDEEKRAVSATCKRVTDHLLDHGYHLVDKDGEPTTWGTWAPEKLNDDPKWWEERGLNSLEILSHLKVAIHLVGEPRYQKAYEELITRHRYALNTLKAKIPTSVSHDNQLLFLAYYPLLQLERDPGLRTLYTASINRTWEIEREEGSPLWNFIYGACTGQPCDTEASVLALREMPLDFVQWKTRNSPRADLQFSSTPDRRGNKRLLKPLPWTERVIHHWDSNPYGLDGGGDMGEADPTVWLLPYWMGRYHRLIE